MYLFITFPLRRARHNLNLHMRLQMPLVPLYYLLHFYSIISISRQYLFELLHQYVASVKNKLDCLIGYNLMFLVILPRVPCLILIFKPIRIILVEIFRVVVFVAQTVRAVVRAAGLVLRWGAWFVLRSMIDCSF